MLSMTYWKRSVHITSQDSRSSDKDIWDFPVARASSERKKTELKQISLCEGQRCDPAVRAAGYELTTIVYNVKVVVADDVRQS